LVYTNVDIGVQRDFYSRIHRLLLAAEHQRLSRIEKFKLDPDTEPETAIEVTRVQVVCALFGGNVPLTPHSRGKVMRLKRGTRSPPSLDAVLNYSRVARHPGHDCFIVPRHAVPRLLTTVRPKLPTRTHACCQRACPQGSLVVGTPPWGTMYHFELSKSPHLRLMFIRGSAADRYTFHSGFEGTADSWCVERIAALTASAPRTLLGFPPSGIERRLCSGFSSTAKPCNCSARSE
jgi:hypothetical protein